MLILSKIFRIRMKSVEKMRKCQKKVGRYGENSPPPPRALPASIKSGQTTPMQGPAVAGRLPRRIDGCRNKLRLFVVAPGAYFH